MLTIAVHGGAGRFAGDALLAHPQRLCRSGIGRALDAGYAVLAGGGTSLEAVRIAVLVLEDDPLFNAGRGAVRTRDGVVELDAAIMEGRSRRAGAVAAVRHLRNPIEVARRVLEEGSHVLLVAEGAEEFALEQGFVLVPNHYFQLSDAERAAAAGAGGLASACGTVGAVACDARGDLAAATSTGGTSGKHRGRVGDSPLIGAGTYADNRAAAVSATGQGEIFIRIAVAHEVCARMRFAGLALGEAVRGLLKDELASLGGEGGIIAVAADGSVATEFNTEGMIRGVRTSAGDRYVAIGHER